MVEKYDEIYVDTCSLLNLGFHNWLRQEGLDELFMNGKKLSIPYAVKAELVFMAGHASNEDFRKLVKSVCFFLNKLIEHGIAKVVGEKEVMQADRYIMKLVSAERFQKKIAVITQDKQLRADLQQLNRLSSAKSYPVQTYMFAGNRLVRTEGEKKHPLSRNNAAEIRKNLNV